MRERGASMIGTGFIITHEEAEETLEAMKDE